MQFDSETWTVKDGEVAIPVPQRPHPATLRVWRVPTNYRPDGFFVTVQGPGEPQELPACDLRACELALEEQIDAHPAAGLDAAKAAKRERINAERDAKCVADVTVHDRRWQADKRSQELLAQAVSLAQAGLPLPAVWRDADNNDMPVTSIADLLAIAGAIAQQVQAAYAESWARKAAVDAATTIEEVEAA
ncbi:uncharacterized protein DUF4376 [Sulfuritortus calidifontis]|uniref:Uncharacterized protein DUF4376 n=1 Tax=Sulfuritortus calidifontis TaxID=1914471 RepID=A0A4R3JYN1_9PROT|nr:DUF4376 domain-containing protein [Sulfuritortus calidifontis]TCS72094.1 uncharacterized protein DUF4376 [Sulfuritortus calidifontis]